MEPSEPDPVVAWPDDPSVRAEGDVQTPIRKYMGDNPDQTYRTARTAGDRTYRVPGVMDGAVPNTAVRL